MTSNNDAFFWKKKEYISFILSILVFFIHSYFANDIPDESLISLVNHKTSYFFSRSVTQFAVPMFFMLAGLTFYKGYSSEKYPAKIKSRILTLVIPYLVWNTVWMLWEIIGSCLESSFALGISDILKGIFFYGFNQPFWFMFNLIVFSFTAPLIFLIIKNKYVSFSVIAALSLLSAFGIHLPSSVFYNPTSVIFYLIGATAGYHYFDLISQKSCKTTQLLSVIFLSLYILAKNIVPQELHINNYLVQVIVFTMCSFALWHTADIFIERLKPRAVYKRSFAVYAMHLNIAIVILKILSVILPHNPYMEIPKFVIMVVVTLTIINFVCAFLERYLPKLNGFLFGKHIKQSK